MQYAKIIAKEIVENKADAIKASREIYQILVDLDYPAELHAWFDFDEMISDYEEFLKTGRKYYFYRPREELISEIKKASEELIKEKV